MVAGSRVKALAGTVAAAATVAALLSGCSAGTGSTDAATDSGVVVTDTSASDSKATKADSAPSSTPTKADSKADSAAGSGSSQKSAAHDVELDSYSFDLPAYWKGKVDVVVNGDEATIYAKDVHDQGRLMTLSYVDETEPQVAGDIANHLVAYFRCGSGTVEVWTTNFPYLIKSDSLPGLSDESAATLVDLSTGGQLSYDDVKAAASVDDISMAEYNYTKTAITGVYPK
jgi:hypothetical protein